MRCCSYPSTSGRCIRAAGRPPTWGRAREGFTVNLPVPGGSGDALFRSLVDHLAVPLVRAYRPQLVLISAGYDAHRDDPLAGCTLTETGYAAMTRSMREACRTVGAPIGCVLEGGYELDALAASVAATMQALAEPGAGGASAVPDTDMATDARARLARWWGI